MKGLAIVILLISLVVVYYNPSGDSKAQALFKSHPADVTVTLKDGTKTTAPFHAVDVDVMLVFGTLSGEVVKDLMKGQDYHPVLTKDGKGIGMFYQVDYRNSTCGPYTEFVLVFAASATPEVIEGELTAGSVYYHIAHPNRAIYAHKLWLNQKLPIDYGRDLLGLDKVPMKASTSEKEGVYSAILTTPEGESIAKLEVTKPGIVPSLLFTMDLAKNLGVKKLVNMLTGPTLAKVVVPKGLLFPDENPKVISIVEADITAGDWTEKDSLQLNLPELKTLQFQPFGKVFASPYNFVMYPPFMGRTSFEKLNAKTA